MTDVHKAAEAWRELPDDLRAMVLLELDRESLESEDVTNAYQIAMRVLRAALAAEKPEPDEPYYVGEPYEGCNGQMMGWHVSNDDGDLVAECPDESTAIKICGALNAAQPGAAMIGVNCDGCTRAISATPTRIDQFKKENRWTKSGDQDFCATCSAALAAETPTPEPSPSEQLHEPVQERCQYCDMTKDDCRKRGEQGYSRVVVRVGVMVDPRCLARWNTPEEPQP